MELSQAHQLALRLMTEFGLFDKGWTFQWDNAPVRFGCCHIRRKLITLSRELVSRNDQVQVEDTIRHEIAHALCPPKTGHSPVWKAMCKRTGANPVRCYDSDQVDRVEGDWVATCHGCGRTHTKFRRPKRELWCAHKDCKRQNPPPYGQRLNDLCKLQWRNKNAPQPPAPPRSAIEAMKAQLRKEEQ